MKTPKKIKILCLVGPTASGKSDLAVRLAKKLDGEVVSADSRQVYNGLDIGTGKITRQEMRGIRHHLLDVANPKTRFSAELYRRLARKAIGDIVGRGKLPIICGGTGFYIDALFDEDAISKVQPNLKLRKNLERKSAGRLLVMLKRLDRKRWRKISGSGSERNNKRRLIRAVEIAEAEPRDIVADKARPRYEPLFIGITLTREDLRKNISARLEKHLKLGMTAEARRLHRNGLSWKRMDELGLEYRYLARYLRDKISKEELVKKLDTEIWHYAKRQMRWWKRNKKIKWITPADKEKIAGAIGDFLRA